MLRVEFKKKEEVKLFFAQLQVGELFSFPNNGGVYMKLYMDGHAVILKSNASQESGTVMRVASVAHVVRLNGVLECELM